MKSKPDLHCNRDKRSAKFHSRKWFHLFCIMAFTFGASAGFVSAQRSSNTREKQALKAFAKLQPIDVHTHVFANDPQFIAMLVRLHLHLVDILVVDNKSLEMKSLEPQRTEAFAFVNASHGHAWLCTTFDPFQFSNPDFSQSAIKGINQDFARGAIAVKIWKNIGMQLKDASGRYVMPDNPRFEPIYRDIAEHNKTLIAHLAEPDVAWGVHTPNDIEDDTQYYAQNSEWRMDKVPGAPAKKTILAARDHLLEMNPHLRVVGAHLGSMESDVDLIAQRFDRYPNFAIDTAARVPHLEVQPTEKVRKFMLKYQDRVLFGTDLQFHNGDDVSAVIKDWQAEYARDWRYFATRDRFNYEGREVQGLGLPPSVVKKIFHDNALRWFPGINSAHN
jgi:predicted TIM-barrel fold metal-dependent hydrolase